MKHFARFAVLGLLTASAIAMAACSSSQTDKFVSGLTNFGRGLAAVDTTVKQINATVYSQCAGLVATAQSINDLAGQCSKAAPYTSTANAIIDNYCQAQGVADNGIAASISVTAKGVSAAKSTLAANKTACGS